MKLLVMHFSPASHYFLQLSPKNILESETSLIGRKESQYLLVSSIEFAFLTLN